MAREHAKLAFTGGGDHFGRHAPTDHLALGATISRSIFLFSYHFLFPFLSGHVDFKKFIRQG